MGRLELKDMTALRLVDAAPPPADWRYAFPAQAEAGDDLALARWMPDGRFHTAFVAHALIADGAVTLVDAGLGPGPSAYFDGLRGGLDRALQAAGIALDDVACVAFTHFHLDHVGWADHFPNARYAAPAAEIDHWRREGAAAALPHHVAAYERHVAPLLAAGRLEGLDDGEPAPGAIPLRYRSAPGHTPGHAALVAGDESLVIAGDAWHSPLQVERPAWCHRADRDPAAAIRSRENLARWAAERAVPAAAGHFPDDQSFGHVAAADRGFAWRPIR